MLNISLISVIIYEGNEFGQLIILCLTKSQPPGT